MMFHPDYDHAATADGGTRNDIAAWLHKEEHTAESLEGNRSAATSEHEPVFKRSRLSDGEGNMDSTCNDMVLNGAINVAATESTATHNEAASSQHEAPATTTCIIQKSASAPDCLDTKFQQFKSQQLFAGLFSQTAAAEASGSSLPSHKSAEQLFPYVNHHREQVQTYCDASRRQQHQGHQQNYQQHDQQQRQNPQQQQQNNHFSRPDRFIPDPHSFSHGPQHAHPGPNHFFPQGVRGGGHPYPPNFLPFHQNHPNGHPHPNGNMPHPFGRFAENTALQSFLRGGQMGTMPTPTVGDFGPSHESTNVNGMVRRDGTRFGEIPLFLPVSLASPKDAAKVSTLQVLLRQQIEAFQATEDDISTHTRGRNKPINMRQVGIRCRHCAHLPVMRRQKGSTYFPASTVGLYQAAQNMSTTHIQCGLCPEMPNHVKAQFTQLLTTKSGSSGAGRPYWAESAKQMGLVDTEEGIYFVRDLPPGAQIIHHTIPSVKRKTPKKGAD